MILEPITVTYETAATSFKASQLLNKLKHHPVIAWDFEAAVKYSDTELESFKKELERGTSKRRKIELESKLNAEALDHPSHVTLTHCSIAWSDHEAYVFILDNKSITNLVLNYLVTSPQKQILHNATFDFKHLYYHTGKFPQDYEDTQVLAKTLVNHVDNFKAGVKLKELAGRWYGKWAIAADEFKLSQMYENHVLLYSATDACATFKLWEELNAYCSEN